MKFARLVSLVCIMAIFVSTLITGCSDNNQSNTQPSNAGELVNWDYEPIIEAPIQAISDKQTISLGDSHNNINCVIPGGSFDTATQLTLENPQNVPKVMSNEFTPVGAPIEISADTQVRLNQAATLTFRVDTGKYAEDLKAGNIWIAYYDGKAWEYFPPNNVDVSTGVVSFDTYHFCIFGAGKIEIEERMKNYTHSKTVAKMAQKNVDKVVDKIVEQTVEYVLKKQLGLDDETADKSIKLKIMSSLVNDDEYRDIVDKFREGDAEGFNKTMMVFAGKKIAENVEKSALQKGLKFLSGKGAEMLEAGSEAAGYIAEGQYAEAGKIIGEKIADSFMVTKFIKAGAEIVQYNIDTWKDAEIEAAYKAFKDGSDNKFFGYNVDAGDFNALWNQMKGIATRLQSEAVTREIKRREELSMPPPTDAELDAVRVQVKTDLEDQFRKRLSQEDQLAKDTAKLETLVAKFKDSGLLEENMFGYDPANFDLESRLDQLLHLTDKILRDTGRTDWNTTASTNDREISAGDMMALMIAWYSTNGPAEYAKMLLDKFGIDLNQNKTKYLLQKPISKEIYVVTEDTDTLFDNQFGIKYGLANGGQFYSFIQWGVYGGGFRSSTGAWSGAPDGLNPGDKVTINVAIYPGWDPNQKPPPVSLSEGVISIKLNGVPVGELRADINKANEESDNKTGAITVMIPADYKKNSLDILVEVSLPSGSGGMTYHYESNPALSTVTPS